MLLMGLIRWLHHPERRSAGRPIDLNRSLATRLFDEGFIYTVTAN